MSRDRSWKLFKKADDSNNYELYRGISTKNSFHTRIIWSCSWSIDDKYFVTTSRDKRACIWDGDSSEAKPLNNNEKALNRNCELSESITACSFAPKLVDSNKRYILEELLVYYCQFLVFSYLIAFGLETGRIDLVLWDLKDDFRFYKTIPDRLVDHS